MSGAAQAAVATPVGPPMKIANKINHREVSENI